MISTTTTKFFLVLVLVAFLFFPRRPLDPRAPIDNVLDHLLVHLVSDVQQLTGAQHPIQQGSTKGKEYSGDGFSLALTLCGLLSGKRVLFVGPQTTYHLHSLWLSALEALEKRSHQCLGRDFCTFHHICRSSSQGFNFSTQSVTRKKKIPSRQVLLVDNSSVLLYSLSSTLYASMNKQDPAYIYPQVDPYTQVRQSNTFWRRQAKQSDIVLMNRPPLPAPASTYPNGNWSFAQTLCKNNNYLMPFACDDTLDNILVNAAIHATVSYFLPSLLHTLHTLSLDPEINLRNTRLLWHSNWYIQPLCATSGLPNFVPQLSDVFFSEKGNGLTDPWSYYYNAQAYIHQHLLPKVLPYFKVTYLSLDTPDGSSPGTHLRFFRGSQSTLSRSKDCIRHPSPGFSQEILRVVFLNEMVQVLQIYS